MILDKLHTINDDDAIAVARILLKTSVSSFYDYTFDRIKRIKYDTQDGTDAEETVKIYFDGIVNHDIYKSSGWKNKNICIELIEIDRYHDHPYFTAIEKDMEDKIWKHMFLSNHIEATEFLQDKKLI